MVSDVLMEIVMSRHALEQARERGISINEIKKAVQRGAKYFQEKNKIASDYTYIRVIFKKEKDFYFIITVIIRGGQDGK